MNGYEVALFLHICGAVALFSVLALILGPLAMARRVPSTLALQALIRTANRMRWLLPITVVWVYAAAAYMAGKHDLWQRKWVSGAELSLLIILILDLAIVGPRVAAIARAAMAAPDGPPPAGLKKQAFDPILWLACQVLSTTGVGVIALMVFQPDAAGMIAVVAVALAFGLLAGVPGFMRARRVA